MSDVKALRYLLADDADLIAVVPQALIMPGLIPQGTALPAIAVSHVSATPRRPIAAPAKQYREARVQVTIMAATYPQQKQIRDLVRAALPRTHGTVNGVNVERLVEDLEGPDFRDDAAGIYMQTLDYLLTYTE